MKKSFADFDRVGISNRDMNVGKESFFAVEAQNSDLLFDFIEDPETADIIVIVEIIIHLDSIGRDFHLDCSRFALGINISQHSYQNESDGHQYTICYERVDDNSEQGSAHYPIPFRWFFRMFIFRRLP